MTRALRDWFRSATDVRREEYLPAGLMFVYGFLALTSYYIAKAVRNAVFVDRVGAENLPYVYILTAVLVTLFMLVYSRWVDRLKHMTLLQVTFGLLGGTLVLFWWLLRDGSTVVTSGAFYVFIKLFPLLLVSQFWLMANLLFTTRQAKRLFGPIGVGLIVGGIAGGTIADQAARGLGSEDLVLLSAGVLGACALVVWSLRSHLHEDAATSARLVEEISGDALDLLRSSSHLRTIAWILGLTIVVSTLIDWQLNMAVEQFIAGEDAMTAFWGQFFVLQNVASIVVQLLFTGFILRKFGIGVAMLALPVGLLVASLGVLLVPVLLTAALAKGTEGALRYSLDQSTRELLYLPVPTDVKYKVKPLIDLAVYRTGTGVGGLLVLVAHNWLGLAFHHVAILCIALIGGWIAATLRMRSEFRSSIKRLIGVRDVELDELIYRRLDARTIEELRAALRRGDEDEVLYAISLLEHHPPSGFAEDLRGLLGHSSAEVRAAALTALGEIGDDSAVPAVESLLEDPALDVRVEAIEVLCRLGASPAASQMDRFLRAEDAGVRSAAVVCLLRQGNEDQVDLGLATTAGLADSSRSRLRVDAARLLGEAEEMGRESRELLASLFRDEDPAVRREAIRTAGRTRAPELVPLLLEALERGQDRRAALSALAEYGSAVHDRLLDLLADPEVARSVRVRLPALLFTEARQRDVERMMDLLRTVESDTVRFHLLKTLNKLRRDRDDLDFDRYALRPLVAREVRGGYRYALFYDVFRDSEGEESLLLRTLEQRRREAVERALRLLGLRYPQEDLYVAFAALVSSDPVMQQRGFELLDNVLPRRYRELFDPLANPEESPRRRARAAIERFGLRRMGRRHAFRELADGPALWLAILARREAGLALSPEGLSPGDFEERLRADTLLATRFFDPTEQVDIMEIVDRADFLRRTRIFEELRTEDLAGLAALASERSHGTGERLFPEGSPECALHIVVEGAVEARRDGRVVMEAGPGDTIGDLALLDGRPTHYEAVAVEPTRTLRVAREDFFNLLEDRFRVARQVLAYLAGVLRDVEPAGEPVAAGDGG